LRDTTGAEEREESQARKWAQPTAAAVCKFIIKINRLDEISRPGKCASNRACREGTIASTIAGTIKSTVVEAFLRGKERENVCVVVVVEAVELVGNPQGCPSGGG
jgi:hypothetical protein